MPSAFTQDSHHKEFFFSEEDRDLVEAHLAGPGKWYAILEDAGSWYILRHSTKAERDADRSLPKTLSLHRLIAARMGEDLTDDRQVDHINHKTLDDTRPNLRSVTYSQNQSNSRPRTDGTSRYKGVYKHGKGWQAQGKLTYLGTFPTEVEAAQAYDNWARANFGEFAHLNFP